MRSITGILFFVFALTFPALAAAQVAQPNGLVTPLDSRNGETQLHTLFSSRGEAIDFIADGAAEPSTFSPLCDFRATFVLKQSGSSFGVGWYNATGIAPEPADIHVIVPAGAPVGTMITSTDIRSDPSYAGGTIGFALVGGQTHYSETQWNPVCTACTPPGAWIMAVIYRSSVTPNAYYVAFEDGTVGPDSFNNDGDYNDYVYFFEGLSCAGGGEPCETGMPGICGAGLTECNGGTIECRPSLTTREETCNGLDDDCDGLADDEASCGPEEVCDRGVCVGRCMGEFGCAAGLDCNPEGFCVEAACVTVDCPAGEICRAGTCAGPCTDVVCPGDLVCRAGRCADPCEDVTCDVGRVCEGGICLDRCDCAPCSDGLSCDAASGACVDPSCAGVDCSATPGTVCRGGACVDACAGASCPRGQICETGACIDDPTFGLEDAGAGDPDGGALDSGGGTLDGGAGALDGGGAMDGGGGGGEPSSGCGCRATGGGRGSFALVLAALASMIARRRVRRRR